LQAKGNCPIVHSMAASIPLTNRAKPLPSLGRYLLGRAALDLRTFTVDELASLTQVPVNTVYGFLHHLGSGVTKETLPSDSPGRPRKRYSLSSEGVEQLLDENLGIAQLLRAEGLDTAAYREEFQSSAEIAGVKAQPTLTEASDTSPRAEAEFHSTSLDPGNVYARYFTQLRDLYSAEVEVIEVLPRVTRAVSNRTLRAAFVQQVKRTKQQNSRLHQIFKKLSPPTVSPLAASTGYHVFHAITELLQNTEARVVEETEPQARDNCLLAAAQAVAHYRVASYGSVLSYAVELGEKKAVELLQTTLYEEANHPLTQFAADSIRSS
jgi:ferritin-like metal-binding protein YciE